MECPRCNSGTVCKAAAATLPADLYVCDSCEALWLHPQSIGPSTYVGLNLYLQSHGIAGGCAALVGLDRAWDEDQALAAARSAVEAEPESIDARLTLAELLLPGTLWMSPRPGPRTRPVRAGGGSPRTFGHWRWLRGRLPPAATPAPRATPGCWPRWVVPQL